jgi:hypothetical protein
VLFNETTIRERARAQTTVLAKREELLKEARDTSSNSFDVFLSHSILDEELILGAKLELEDQGLSVYVDWITDKKLDRTAVTSRTAAHLRARMGQCKMLVYVHTENAKLSRWCPWELGYFDALRGGNVFIFPIVSGRADDFKGQEYLGLYPYLDKAPPKTSTKDRVWINKAGTPVVVECARSKLYKLA